MAHEFGKTLLIINPVAQLGRAKALGEDAVELFAAAGVAVDVAYSESSKHAEDLGAGAADAGYATVIALGGDGIIHHVAEGLLRISADERPVFGVIPVGSGNDFARTVGIPVGVKPAVEALLATEPRALDVVQVNDKHYLQTMSFGLDAAIAIGTEERRLRTGETGLKLYFMTGVDEIVHRMYTYEYEAELESADGEVSQLSGSMKLFALQNGRTYGGGFPVTPDARPDDGLLNICIARGDISKPKTLAVFALATKGKHTGSKYVSFHRARRLKLRFEENAEYGMPVCQFDGEVYNAPTYEFQVLPRELRVLTAWTE